MLLDQYGRKLEINAERQTVDPRTPLTYRVPYRPYTQAGVIMTADRAVTISSVWACVRFLSQTVAMLPWRVKREVDDGAEIQRTHPVDFLLYKRSSPEWSSMQLRETLLSWCLLRGNGYAEIERSIDGRPIALWPIHPDRVTVMRDIETNDLYYEVTGERGGTVYLDPMDMFHVRGMGDGPVGLSVIAYAAESLGWVKAAQVFGSSFFGRGANPSGIVKMKKPLSPEGLGKLRAEFGELYGGPRNQNSIAVLDNEMDWQSISTVPEQAQFIQTQQHLIDEVCRWFGVPPHKIYHLLRATFSNIEHQSIEVVVDSVMPWAKRFEDEANYKLFGNNRGKLYSDIDIRELLRGDTAARMAYYAGLRNIGAVNVNEIRHAEGMNGIGPDGDKYTLQSGMTTLEKIGEDPAPAPEPAADPVEPAADPVEPVDDPAEPAPEPAENSHERWRFMHRMAEMEAA
jgi:HK97 family phage portal protein